MVGDADWVENVKRWYFSAPGEPAALKPIKEAQQSEIDAIGYESADPSLCARVWAEPSEAAAPATRLGR